MCPSSTAMLSCLILNKILRSHSSIHSHYQYYKIVRWRYDGWYFISINQTYNIIVVHSKFSKSKLFNLHLIVANAE